MPIEGLSSSKLDLIAKTLQKGDLDILDSLSERERSIVIQVLKEWAESGDSDLLKGLWQKDYIRTPVDPKTFLLDDYYLGKYFDKESRMAWVPEIEYVLNNQIVEVCITGANSVGKSTASFMLLLYKIYLLSCLRNPQEYHNLAPGSMIVVGLFNSTLKQSKSVDMFNFNNIASQSPYFKELFPAVLRDDGIHFPKAIRVIEGSRTLHALGLNMIGGVLDEVSAYKQGASPEERGEAYKIYVEVRSRMENRFIKKGGIIPGLLCLVSSADLTTSFLEEHLDLVESKPELRQYFHKISFCIWDMKPPGTYSGEKFRLLVGDGVETSRILDKKEEVPEENSHRIVFAPIEHYHSALIDPDKFLNNSAGISTAPHTLLIPDRDAIKECIHPLMNHPFTIEELPIPIGCDYDIEDAFKYDDFGFERRASGYTLSKCPGSPRAIHLDLAVTGCAAALSVACIPCGSCYICRKRGIVGMQTIEKMRPDGSTYLNIEPNIEFEIMIAFPSIEGKRTDLAKIKKFVTYLRNMNMPIRIVTVDRWESEFLVQDLLKEGFLHFRKKLPERSGSYVGNLSLEKTDIPYTYLKQIILERRAYFYDSPRLKRELSKLKHDKKKRRVYFEGKGSKDLGDTLAGCTFHLMSDKLMQPSIHADPIVIPKKETSYNDYDWLIHGV